jgi:hypothetical protein
MSMHVSDWNDSMQFVWTLPSLEEKAAPPILEFSGRYQDMLRAVGGWLDARGYRLVGLSGTGDSLVVEVEAGPPGTDICREAFRLDFGSLERLAVAAQADRDRFQ